MCNPFTRLRGLARLERRGEWRDGSSLRESCALLTLSTKTCLEKHNPDMSNDSHPLVSIRGTWSNAAALASSTLRYYEKLGLIASEREGSSEHRRYRESTFLKICYITIGQRAGFSLEEIAAQLATLPDRFPLPKGKTGRRCSRVWDERIDQRIAELKKLKIDIVNCTCGRTKASAGGR